MLNKVMLIGHLGRDPEFQMTSEGRALAKFSLAVSRSFTVRGERKEETEWFNIVVWEKLAVARNTCIKAPKCILRDVSSSASTPTKKVISALLSILSPAIWRCLTRKQVRRAVLATITRAVRRAMPNQVQAQVQTQVRPAMILTRSWIQTTFRKTPAER